MATTNTNQTAAKPWDKLWQSGIIWTVASFVVGLGNYAFQMILARGLSGHEGEFGYVSFTTPFINCLGLPIAIATAAVTHYLAQFNAANDKEKLKDLLAGCNRFLLKLTIAGSLLGILLLKPLGLFFNFPRNSLMLTALLCLLLGLWSGYALALCQGLAWFKRLSAIALLGVVLKLAFTWLMTKHYPAAETGVLATGVALLANAILLFWWRDIFPSRKGASPWNRDFIQYLAVAAAGVGGGLLFVQGDLLVAQKFFNKTQLDAYSKAGTLGRALVFGCSPLLTVLFTARSGHRVPAAVVGQMKLLALYAFALLGGATVVIALGALLMRLLVAPPEAVHLVTPFATAMACVGIVQAAGMWALASRWYKLTLLYGALGLGYWLLAFSFGRSPETLLTTMTYAAGASAAILVLGWILALRHSHK